MQTFFIFKNYRVSQQDLEIRYGKEEERKKKITEVEKREKEEQKLRRIQIENEEDKKFSTRNKATILDHKKVQHNGFLKGPEGITCDLPDDKSGTLIYAPEINDHFAKILNDIKAVKNSHDLNKKGDTLDPENENDDYSPWLKRNNTLMYGTPGTGKTVFVTELVHHLYQEFGKPLEERKGAYAEQLIKIESKIKEVEQGPGTEAEKLAKTKKLHNLHDEQREEMLQFIRQNKIPPVIQINGSKIQKASGMSPNSLTIAEMIVKVIKDYKREYFGDEYSNEPYIVFFEEADEMGDVITKKEGNYLKDIKDWLSTSEDAGGLTTNAQDLNSIVIAATNHYEKLEPGAIRRGRLGKVLNFNWNPQILKEYGEQGGPNRDWPKINWPKNDLGWTFEGNANYPELAKLCEKIGYSVFKDKFAPKAVEIIADYQKLKRSDPSKLEEKEKKELGRDIPTGKKEPTGQKDSHGNPKTKELMTCNWLLHFLHTFHYYNDNRWNHLFTSALQIMRYDFGNEYYKREELQNIYKQIGAEVDQIGLVYEALKKVREEVGSIKDFLAEAHNLRQEAANLRAAITDNEKLITELRNNTNENIRILQSNIEHISNQSANSNEIGALKARLTILEGRISSGNYGSEGSARSGNTIPVSEYNEKVSTINKLNTAVSNLVRALNRKEDNLQPYVDEINRVLSAS